MHSLFTQAADAAATLAAVRSRKPVSWVRTPRPAREMTLDPRLVEEAEARLRRFAPWLAAHFPDTDAGLIESPLQEAEGTATLRGGGIGKLWLKRDDALSVSGSIKARGGIHEVLMVAEALAEELEPGAADLRAVLESAAFREEAARRPLVVGSTGNLGLSIGTVGPELGFATEVHMSVDAKQWKKDLLREKGATVVEHAGLFSEAIALARESAERDPHAHFVDDEYSYGLLAGYAVAALRLRGQLSAASVVVDDEHPLNVYLPCGVGGGPGGVTWGLKHVFGDAVRCHVVEPVESPCLLVGVATGRGHAVSCQDVGLSGHTLADGLAVQRPSQLVVNEVAPFIDGFHTVSDSVLLAGVRWLYEGDGVLVEPSATAGLTIPWRVGAGTHLVWLTGGSLVPEAEREATLAAALGASES